MVGVYLIVCARLAVQRVGRLSAYHVSDPERFGVVSFNESSVATSIEEKPDSPKSSYAVTGIYFYDNDVLEMAAGLKPSARGELEITDINLMYLERGDLSVEVLGRGYAWLDTGTHDSLLEASSFISTVQRRQSLLALVPRKLLIRWLDNGRGTL